MLQKILEKPLEKKAGRNYGPPGNKTLVYFLDDMNMPEVSICMNLISIQLNPVLGINRQTWMYESRATRISVFSGINEMHQLSWDPMNRRSKQTCRQVLEQKMPNLGPLKYQMQPCLRSLSTNSITLFITMTDMVLLSLQTSLTFLWQGLKKFLFHPKSKLFNHVPFSGMIGSCFKSSAGKLNSFCFLTLSS